MGVFSDFRMFLGSLSGLREFLKDRITVEESIEIVRNRLENREENFLNIIGRVYNTKSPHSKIFTTLGYEFKDVKCLVEDLGLEGALKHLAQEGAYIRIDEFKGEKDWIRRGKSVRFSESDFDNTISGGIEMTSGATRSQGTRVLIDFDALKESSCSRLFSEYVLGNIGYPSIIWYPGALCQKIALDCVKADISIAGCYSQTREMPKTNLRNVYPNLRRALIGRMLSYEGRLLGAKIPNPEFVGLEDCAKIAKQVSEIKKEHSKCLLHTFVSSALRICAKAKEMGLEMDGAVFECSGEPITPTRRREMEAVGVKVIPFYAAAETSVIADGCLNHKHSDEMHLLMDCLAVVKYKREIKDFGMSVDAFLLTSLLKNAPKIMINVEIGDYGVLKSESCSCGYGKFGFKEKMYDVRSFEKLTGEGMTLIGGDMVDVIEEDLPAMFGGSSTDYQIVEDEDEHGFTHMDILVSPAIGKIDEKKLVDAVYDGLRKRSKGRNLSFEVWEDAGTIRVKRGRPILTRRGKLFSFQIKRKKK